MNVGKKRDLQIQFPLGGLNRKFAIQSQPPFTTPDCQNVRAVDPIAGRERGGSRPGLVLSHIDDLVNPIRMLYPMVIAMGDDFTAYSDNFVGSSLAAAWTTASWATASPSILSSVPAASIDYSEAEGECVHSALTIDTSKAYTVEMFIVPWAGSFNGKYRLYFRLDNSTPDIETAGCVVELVDTSSTGTYIATLKSVVATVSTTIDSASGTTTVSKPGWLSATVSGTTVTVYWNGAEIMSGTVGAHSGSRVGFGIECTAAGGLCLANAFRVQYYSTSAVSTLRSKLIASASGSLYHESTYGRLTAVSSNLTVADDRMLIAAQSGQSLYIADYENIGSGTDGSVSGTTFDATSHTAWDTLGVDAHDMVVVISDVQGTAVAGTYKIQTVTAGTLTLTAAAGTGACSYRIERAPKIYDPVANTITLMYATTGQVPSGCPLICHYNDRIVLAGAEEAPHVWYMSRQSDELDWDYSQTDSQRAVAGTSSEMGVPGDPITALIPHSDDYLLIANRTSLWRMRGDPAFGGSIDAISRTIGIIGTKAWCITSDGTLVFLSHDGIYAVNPGGDSYPVPISRELIPKELLNVNPETTQVLMEYDVQGGGVHIFLTPDSSNDRIHWWLDWQRKSFWPLSLASDYEPTATCVIQASMIEDMGVILGCRDGFLRRFNNLAETDCGTAFTSYVYCGPIGLNKNGWTGYIVSMDAVLADDSGDVTWNLYPSDTYEGTWSATSSDTGTWSEGLNASVHPACRGQAFMLKITGAGNAWAIEGIDAAIAESGRRRLT